MILRVYTDGGSRGNPGPSASGAVIKEMDGAHEGKTIATAAKWLGNTTNNQAEYTAIIIGLEKAKELGATVVQMYMDSELAVKQLTGKYKVKNPDIAKRYLEVHNLMTKFSRVSFTHVPREKNAEADAVVNETIDKHAGAKKHW